MWLVYETYGDLFLLVLVHGALFCYVVLSDCVLLFVLEIICETSWWSRMKMRTLVCQVLRGTTSVGTPQTKPWREGPWKPGVALAPFLGLLRDSSSSELFRGWLWI